MLSQCYAQMKISFPGLIFAQYKSINIIIIIYYIILKIFKRRQRQDYAFNTKRELPERPHLSIDYLKGHQVHPRLPQSKKMQNAEFSLNNIQQKFAALSGNQIPINF